MCRIAGIFNPSSTLLEEEILRMRDAMYRGGPDGKGIFIDQQIGLAFGHRRLALLDLTEAGHQPMYSTDKKVVLSFNGEIYNFQELRTQLEHVGYQFHTQTDTEVILSAYQYWGTDCFQYFNGMFAIALFDILKNEIILARDHAGIKPLYYALSTEKNNHQSSLIFASEIRAFKALKPDWPENKDWKIPFLAYGHLPEPFTTLDGVEALPKGTFAKFNIADASFTIYTFYQYTYQKVVKDKKEAVLLIKDKVEKAVQRHLISDAPLGVFLSGGIDSSILAILAATFSTTKIKTLSIVFEEQNFSEEVYQKMVVEQTGVEHHSFVVTNKMLRDEFQDIMEAMDQPSIDGINTYFICKFAKAYGLTAVLSGLGADELLGGYDSSRRSELLKRLTILPAFILAMTNYAPNEKIKRIAYLKDTSLTNKYLFYRGIYNPQQIAKLLNIPIEKVCETLKIVRVVAADTQNEAQRAAHVEQHLYMQNQLLKDTDYMSMWHSVEVRVPFLDKEVINACNSILPSLKFDLKEKPKILLIEAFKDVLPEAIWNRRKQGFTFPFTTWINHIIPTKRDADFEERYDKLNRGIIHWSKYWTFILATTPINELIFLRQGYERVCFYNLDAFATMGGIEKFNRAFLYALSRIENQFYLMAEAASMHDTSIESAYFNESNYRFHNKSKVDFVWKELLKAYKYNQVILGHVNLALFGLILKRLYPKTKMTVVTHGIEVWSKLEGMKLKLLQKADLVLAVSNFTKDKLVEVNGVDANKIKIFHNTIDPFFQFPNSFKKPDYLINRYGLNKEDKVIFTLTRLAYTEKYKGYDKVIEVLGTIVATYPNVRYLIAGKPDMRERTRLNELIAFHKLEKNVFLIGFITEEEVTDHYKLADVFIMPSKKEGFGIVFIEAMACGLPVIAGNQDGSVDALRNGELGILINPEDKVAMIQTLHSVFEKDSDTEEQKAALQKKVTEHFGFSVFEENLKQLLVVNG